MRKEIRQERKSCECLTAKAHSLKNIAVAEFAFTTDLIDAKTDA